MDKIATLVLRRSDFKVYGDLFGCESGALDILDKGYLLKGAFGDFDSILEVETEVIKQSTDLFVQVPSQKDETDSELAIKALRQMGYTSIHVYGALGDRVDHQHINLVLMAHYPEVILYGFYQKIQAYLQGVYDLNQDDFDVFSVFTFTHALIDLEECLYPLKNHPLDALNRLTISNAWMTSNVKLTVHEGAVWVVYSKA